MVPMSKSLEDERTSNMTSPGSELLRLLATPEGGAILLGIVFIGKDKISGKFL